MKLTTKTERKTLPTSKVKYNSFLNNWYKRKKYLKNKYSYINATYQIKIKVLLREKNLRPKYLY